MLVDWRTQMLREVAIDPARVHFLGHIPYADYRRLLPVSAAQVYLTYPLVLSWSMPEAMACGCLVIGSDTAPVREVILHDDIGLLVDFFSGAQLVGTVAEPLRTGRDSCRCGSARCRPRVTIVWPSRESKDIGTSSPWR